MTTDLVELPPWLAARLRDKISVAEMAEAMAMSERNFYRRCVEVMGMTPLALLKRLRLERAQSLLEDASLPIKEVARASGLGDATSFGKQFRAHFGVSPAAYRERFGRPRAR